MLCAVTLTFAPETTAPELSETVPAKLPVAWLYINGLHKPTKTQRNNTESVCFLDIVIEPLSAAPTAPKENTHSLTQRVESASTADTAYKLPSRLSQEVF